MNLQFVKIPWQRTALVLLLWTMRLSVWTPVVVDAQQTTSDFDPYVLNGGLLAAVAGKDFCVLATDTRMYGASGYDILKRHHLSSRLWAAHPNYNPNNNSSSSNGMRPDGSLDVDGRQLATNNKEEALQLLHTIRDDIDKVVPPVWIGSVGCQADCECLKRTVQSHVRAARHFGIVNNNNNHHGGMVSSVAQLLAHTLYSRRGFPFYSFCIVAGLDPQHRGHVCVYDAIGSHEPVAVAVTGTGKELLQPILDRAFRSPVHGRPSTVVDCNSPEEAVAILLQAYRSVSERDIGVGDGVIFLCIQKQEHAHEKKVWWAPLKQH